MFAQARVHCDNKPLQIGLNHYYNMTFSISPHECKYSPLKRRLSCSKREPFRVLRPLLRHVVPLNDGNCRLTIPVGKGRCARDALPHAFHIGVFKFVFTISTTIKHIDNGSESVYYNEVIMGMIASQIASLAIVYSTVNSDAYQRKHQNSASLSFVRGIHWEHSPHKWPVSRKMFPCDDVTC